MHKKLPIALTMGEPSSISSEITLKTFLSKKQNNISPFMLIGSYELIKKWAENLKLDVSIKKINSPEEAFRVFNEHLPVLNIDDANSIYNQTDLLNSLDKNNDLVTRSIEIATKLALDGEVKGVCTNPINKAQLKKTGFEFDGHTDFIASLCNATSPVMMLLNNDIKVVPLTIHISLKEVAFRITKDNIIDTVKIISNDLKSLFKIETPKIAICGLNPHAGENGVMGDEEVIIIKPAKAILENEFEIKTYGPYPSDSMFAKSTRQKFDCILGMYHDQVLIPLKAIDFEKAVNVTLGLPIIRTSPAHGTAEDIAGKNIANHESLTEALKLTDKLYKNKFGN